MAVAAEHLCTEAEWKWELPDVTEVGPVPFIRLDHETIHTGILQNFIPLPSVFKGKNAAAVSFKTDGSFPSPPVSFRSEGIREPPSFPAGPTTILLLPPLASSRPCSETPPSSAAPASGREREKRSHLRELVAVGGCFLFSPSPGVTSAGEDEFAAARAGEHGLPSPRRAARAGERGLLSPGRTCPTPARSVASTPRAPRI
jgi:hypothetical protein